jgi:hypothetical protein
VAKVTVKAVTAADIDAAEAALRQGRQALEDAREAFFDGRGDWDAVKAQEAVIEYAEAQLIKLARDRDKYDESVRQAELGKLREEIDAESLASGDELVTLLANVEDAVKAFAKGFQDRNAKILAWRSRAEELNVGVMNARRLVPSSTDGGIALVNGPDGTLRVGTRILSLQYSARFLTSLIYSLATSYELIPYFRDTSSNGPINDVEAVRSLVKNLDHESDAIPEDALFFRTHDGARLYVTGPNNGFSEEIMKRDGLRQISREEALND